MSAARQKRWRRLTTRELAELPDGCVEIVRVKKSRVYPSGWSPFWRWMACCSAVVSMLLAMFWLWLLICSLFGNTGFWPSCLETPSLHWMAGSVPGAPIAAVPEPSRTMLALIGLSLALLRRRR